MPSRVKASFQAFIDWWTTGKMGLVLAVIGISVTLIGHLNANERILDLRALFGQLWQNLGTELLSIALTVLLIDALHVRRERTARAERDSQRSADKTDREKKRLIRQLSSSVNDQTRMAAEELWANGWLEDGSLEWAKLSGADLQDVNLLRAKLMGASMYRCNLRAASLYHADLEVARLDASDMQDAKLNGANLTKAQKIGRSLSAARRNHARWQPVRRQLEFAGRPCCRQKGWHQRER